VLLLVVTLVWVAPARALWQGDLLVSDLANARVLRVRANGSVSVLSPQPGSGPNLLDAPAGIAVTPDQRVFVVDNATNDLIEIDPVTGAQSEIPLFRIVNGAYVASSTGTGPWGLALDDFGVLWVSATTSNIVRRIGIATGVVETVLTASDLGTGGGPFGVWVSHDELETELIVANDTVGMRLFSPGSVETIPPAVVNGSVWDVDLIEDQLNLLVSLQRTPGSGAFSCGANSGLYGTIFGTSGPLAIGGLIRCPYAMVLGDVLYVAEAESTIGGGARVVRLASGTFTASLFASLPDGPSDTIPAGITYVAVPEASSAAGALVAIACLLSLQRRKRCFGDVPESNQRNASRGRSSFGVGRSRWRRSSRREACRPDSVP
jgi:DNA-binding beta-propeller fold protein YncE